MPWSTPTLRDVRKLTRDYVTAQLGAAALIPNSVLRIMSDAQAALSHLTMMYVDWIAKQLLPDTAETEWLDRHGVIWLVNADGSKGRKTATYASGTANVSASVTITLPVGSRFTYINGMAFQSTEEVELTTVATPVPLVALYSGPDGNVETDEPLTSTDVSGAIVTATVINLTGGVDTESDEDLRSRVLFRIQNPPMGGDEADYITWTRAVAGVTRAWSFPNEMGMGTVTVRFMMDDLRSANNGLPEGEDIAAVMAYLDTVRPVAIKDYFVVAPIPYFYDLTISQLTTDTPSVRAKIEAAIKAMELQRSAPGQTMYRSWIDEAISGAIGEDHHELTFTTTTMPSNGYMPVLGNINYDT